MQERDPREEYSVVDTPSGQVRGRMLATGAGTQVARFLGIPFAQAPVGALRFAAPQPVEPWAGVRDALEFGPTAQRGDPGVTLIPEPSIPGEATLNVNVITPAPGDDDAKLPVLVWIHGGGYFAGSPASDWYSSPAFARDGVVTVVISYRLGFDGFGYIPGTANNRGVRDWLCALQWVQSHIASFGGDRGNVTIAGQSAGGGAVLTLLGMRAAEGLFHKVISLSGAVGVVDTARARRLTERLAQDGGIDATLDGFRTLSEERLIELQKKATDISSPKVLNTVMEQGLPLGPTIDGELIFESTQASLHGGVGSAIPVWMSTVDDEFAMAFADAPKLLKFVPAGLLLYRMGGSRSARRTWLQANAESRARGTASVLGRYISDKMFKVGLLQVADSRGTSPTWVSRFAWPSPVFGAAVHCLDVPYFFDCLDSTAVEPLAGSAPPQQLADTLHGAALKFIKDCAPGWEQYRAQAPAAMVFNSPASSVRPEGYASVLPLLQAAR